MLYPTTIAKYPVRMVYTNIGVGHDIQRSSSILSVYGGKGGAAIPFETKESLVRRNDAVDRRGLITLQARSRNLVGKPETDKVYRRAERAQDSYRRRRTGCQTVWISDSPRSEINTRNSRPDQLSCDYNCDGSHGLAYNTSQGKISTHFRYQTPTAPRTGK
jgi:hypothetical protein